MESLRAERIERGEVEALQDIEQHERGQTLAVGRQFQDVQTTVIGGDRRDDLPTMSDEVLGGKEGAARGDRRDNLVRNRPLVKGARPVFRNRRERLGERWQSDDVAFGRCVALEQKVPRRAGVGAQLVDLPSPVPGHTRRNWEPALGVPNRRVERARKRKAAMRIKDRRPGINGTRYGHGMDRVGGNGTNSLRNQRIERSARAGTAGAVIAPDRLSGHMQHAEAVPADAGHVRLDHAQDGHRGHRCVGGGAPGA